MNTVVHPAWATLPPPSLNAVRALKAAWRLCVLAVMAYMLLSPSGLLLLGIPYDAPVGNPLFKLHPGTWLMALAYFLALGAHGHPLAVAWAQWRREPLLAAYMAATVVLIVYAVARFGIGGAAFLIDTHLMAALSAFTLLLLPPSRHRRMLWLLAALLLANAALGVAEAAVQQRLIPLRISGGEPVVEEFFRASAFLGHPLANAQVTATLMPVVLLLPLAVGWQVAMGALLALALLAFGGRTSFVLAMAFYGLWFTVSAFRALVLGRLNYLQITGGAVGAVAALAGVVGLVVATGLGERIFKSLAFDHSAGVRVRIWSVLDYMTDFQHWFGASADEMEVLYLRMGLQLQYEAIENFWLLIYVQYGAVGFLVFAAGLGCLLAWAWRRAFGALRVAVLLLVLVASSNNSLASKTQVLIPLVVAVAAAAHLAPARRPGLRPAPLSIRPPAHA